MKITEQILARDSWGEIKARRDARAVEKLGMEADGGGLYLQVSNGVSKIYRCITCSRASPSGRWLPQLIQALSCVGDAVVSLPLCEGNV